MDTLFFSLFYGREIIIRIGVERFCFDRVKRWQLDLDIRSCNSEYNTYFAVFYESSHFQRKCLTVFGFIEKFHCLFWPMLKGNVLDLFESSIMICFCQNVYIYYERNSTNSTWQHWSLSIKLFITSYRTMNEEFLWFSKYLAILIVSVL